MSLLILLLLFFFFLLGRPLQKSPRLSFFKSDRDEIWRYFSLSKYTSIDRVGFSNRCHTFKLAAVTLFHTEKCCCLVSEHKACDRQIYSSVRQFLIYSTFVLVVFDVLEATFCSVSCDSIFDKSSKWLIEHCTV